MATRSMIGFYMREQIIPDDDACEALIYRHWDGYPSCAFVELATAIKDFYCKRGNDIEYMAARVLQQLCNDHEGPCGYGITRKFHGDIEWFYAVMPHETGVLVKVYAIPFDAKPDRWKMLGCFIIKTTTDPEDFAIFAKNMEMAMVRELHHEGS